MRLRILLLLVVLIAVFPTPVVNGCQALLHGVLDVTAAVLNQAGHAGSGAVGNG